MSSNTPLAHQSDTYTNPFEIGSDDVADTSTGKGISDPLTSLQPEFVDLSSPVSVSHAPATTAINIDNVAATPTVSGSIGQSNLSANRTPSFNSNTLDEPVSETILRDLRNVALKLQQVLHPKARRNVLKDWDLWGPLILCLSLAIMLSIAAPKEQEISVFTMVFIIVSLGAVFVTINAKLLGGNVSFFQSVCIIGYCIFPLVLVALISMFVKSVPIRLPLVIVAFAWSSYASVNFLSSSHLANRRALAVYPLFLFYSVIAWMVLIAN